ncbi:kell blood group glycoprotein isoform X1 [Esox lucius]|uniref:Kell metallo-endopeptidase (Kell blood group) n=1 Tax=Esox lucius TaxID=8010 RepID=A0A3P8YM49_ESOLU|nr:kell blood group glycoprotein isoform X1 [Esox lucius]
MAKNTAEPQIDCELQPQSDALPEPHLLPKPQPQFKNLFLPKAQPQLQSDLLSETHPQPHPNPFPEPQHQAEEEQHQAEEWKPQIWKRHHILLLLLGSSFCLSILGLIYFFHQHPPVEKPPASTPCTSPACQRVATRLAVTVDPFANPCDYFLDTCGYKDGGSLYFRGRQRGKNVPLHLQGLKSRVTGLEKELGRQTDRRDGAPVNRMSARVDALLLALRDVLESEDCSSPGDSAKQKACRFYRSCMDIGPTENAGPEPFLWLVHQLGGWAVSGPWNQTDFNSTLHLLMRDYATFPFFNVYVGKDPNDTQGDKMYIQIDQPDFQIPIEWSNKTLKSKANTQILRPFLASCQKLLDLLGFPFSSTSIHVGLFISLSSELAVEASPLAHRLERGLLYQRLTIKELQTLAPAIDWLGCLRATFHPHPVSQSDHVLLHNLPYIIHMSRVISKWLDKHELSNSGPLHTFMVFSLLHTVIPALDSRFAQTEKKFSSALGTEEEDVPRWKQCVLQTEKGFDMILTHLLRETIGPIEAEEMVQNIFSSIKSKLPDVIWTDEDSRISVLNEIWSLTPRLENNTFSVAELNQLYSKVTIHEHNFFSNYIQTLSLQQKRRNKLFSQSERADILSITPFLSRNELIFPIGMFVQPLFHPTYPRAVNFGVLGTLMAKDILQLLLPNIHSQSASPSSIAECVMSLYSNVTEGRGRVGALTPRQHQEMWMQYSALQVALQAYKESLKKYPWDFTLSGLSHIHLFLTSFIRINCDTDLYNEFMPFEHSFLVTVICGKSDLCPTTFTCQGKPQRHFLQMC